MNDSPTRDPLLASMTRRYLDAQNEVARRQALLIRAWTLLRDLRRDDCTHMTEPRRQLLEAIDEVLK